LLGRPRDLKRHYPTYSFSIGAQAKLSAACRYHRPPTFSGPAAILCSAPYREKLRVAARAWDILLPNRVISVVGNSHREVLDAVTPETAVKMQSIFDAARAQEKL
jgi:hypothetical protein